MRLYAANIRKREQEQKQELENAQVKDGLEESKGSEAPEHNWRRSTGRDNQKHHGAFGKRSGTDNEKIQSDEKGSESEPERHDDYETEYQRLRSKYTPQEITLLRSLQHEATQTRRFLQNPGDTISPLAPLTNETIDISIDGADAMTPDNWIPRSANLIRRTGQHPLNAEPKLSVIFDAGLVTPNELHYVRNHGSVPRLYWGEHILDICDGNLKLDMDGLASGRWRIVNLQVALACDGNRRGELNMLKKSKGFDWGPGALGCAFWKGVLVADVLASLGVKVDRSSEKRSWVNFEGADEPSEGKYATSLPLEYVMDPCNDVLLAFEMNNAPLPPDHGFPVRLLVPGYVGGRSVKWLARMWLTDHENDSHYHIWDNRVLPGFVTEKDGDFATAAFHHPSTACMEQNLNSVIVKPAQGEEIDTVELLKKDTYRVEGYAYDGGGHEVQRVELSLDNGKTWLFCLRNVSGAFLSRDSGLSNQFPDRPIRNGTKFWTWLHWHVDIDVSHFIRAESFTVRCFNVFKNTQPERPNWNLMGMMNNGWYIVKSEARGNKKLLFRHPYDAEGSEGWMKPSVENQLAAAQQNSDIPDKQFTREEIEKHNTRNDCWLVINGNVYDATSVLEWHPGGTAAILANAGKLDLEVTSSFENVHDEYAHKKLTECAIGKVTDKGKKFIREQAKANAEKAASSEDVVLNTKRWNPVTLVGKKQVSKDTFTYTFSYGKSKKLGLGTCQHIQFGIHMLDKMLIRSYTPTRPIRECEEDGTLDLTVKTYFPDENQPGGAFSSFLHELPDGAQVDICGPTGEITYLGNGKFNIEGVDKTFKNVGLVLGGSGITPGYALIKRMVQDGDDAEIAVVDANKTEGDILLREELSALENSSQCRLTITHVLSHPRDKENWEKKGGLSGHVNAAVIKQHLAAPSDDSVVFLCGPPGMIQKAALPALKGK